MTDPINFRLVWHGRDWEVFSESASRDFYIAAPDEETGVRWVLNEFDSGIDDREQAFVRSDEFDTLQEALERACERVQNILDTSEGLAMKGCPDASFRTPRHL